MAPTANTGGGMNKATEFVGDLNEIAAQVATLIPVVGTIAGSIIRAFRGAGAQPPETFTQAIERFTREIELIKQNDAAWRAAHPEDTPPTPGT
jgi:hypothetical protein